MVGPITASGMKWAPSMLMFSTTWPETYYGQKNGKWADMGGFVQDSSQTLWGHPVPTSWAAYMGTKSFWENYWRKYGTAALRFPMMFKSTCYHRFRWTSARRWKVEYAVSELRDELFKMRHEFDHRRQLWYKLRPWYVSLPSSSTPNPDSVFNHRGRPTTKGSARSTSGGNPQSTPMTIFETTSKVFSGYTTNAWKGALNSWWNITARPS